jgi:hypothetical protein
MVNRRTRYHHFQRYNRRMSYYHHRHSLLSKNQHMPPNTILYNLDHIRLKSDRLCMESLVRRAESDWEWGKNHSALDV